MNDLLAYLGRTSLIETDVCKGLRASGVASESLLLGWSQGRLPGRGDMKGQYGLASLRKQGLPVELMGAQG